jgi:MFS family permease
MSLAAERAAASSAPPRVAARAGRLACFCPAGAPVEGEWRGVAALAGGFAASVLSQTLVLGLAPLAGLLLAPQASFAVLPLGALLLGAALATFPASLLLDAFGRRVSFALGASHGLAGALLCAWALSVHSFVALLLGMFWLGIAQGFSLFYRHEAGLGANRAQRAAAIGLVFGAGALAGLAGPAVADLASGLSASAYVGAALAAGAAQFAAFSLAAFTSRRLPAPALSDAPAPRRWARMAAPTLVAGLAWFAMNLVMLAAPFSMIGCGVAAAGVFGAVAWHVVAMYAPALLLAFAPVTGAASARWLAALGLFVIVLALIVFIGAREALGFAAALVGLALGWSLATAGATLWLHEDAAPDRMMLATHDAILFACAIAGALAAFPFAR